LSVLRDCGAFVALLHNHAKIVRAHANRESPKPAARPLPVGFHSLRRCRHGCLLPWRAWWHENHSQDLNGPEAPNRLAGSPSGYGPIRVARITWTPPQPMGGAPLTGYDVLSSTGLEAMKKPSRAGGAKPSKARSRRSSRPKRNGSKATSPRSEAAQQLGEWLGILGMSEYAKCFAENDVDLTVLPHLTDHDLKELGVSLGHRR
jgi:hypothetical protein